MPGAATPDTRWPWWTSSTRGISRRCASLAPGEHGGPVPEAVDALFSQLRADCRRVAVLHEASPRSLDAIAAIGELASSRLVTAALVSAGIPAIWADPRELIVTDESFTAAVAAV